MISGSHDCDHPYICCLSSLLLLVIHYLFRHIFNGLEERYAEELAVVRAQYPSEPVQFTEQPLIIHWSEGMQMLRDAGHEVRTCWRWNLSA